MQLPTSDGVKLTGTQAIPSPKVTSASRPARNCYALSLSPARLSPPMSQKHYAEGGRAGMQGPREGACDSLSKLWHFFPISA